MSYRIPDGEATKDRRTLEKQLEDAKFNLKKAEDKISRLKNEKFIPYRKVLTVGAYSVIIPLIISAAYLSTVLISDVLHAPTVISIFAALTIVSFGGVSFVAYLNAKYIQVD